MDERRFIVAINHTVETLKNEVMILMFNLSAMLQETSLHISQSMIWNV